MSVQKTYMETEAMTTALTKVDTPLMERYTTTCVRCGYLRQIFGTAEEARTRAIEMGWEFRGYFALRGGDAEPTAFEQAYCPHCKILVTA